MDPSPNRVGPLLFLLGLASALSAQALDRRNMWTAFASKYEMRVLLRGGPFLQPEYFALLDESFPIPRFVDQLVSGALHPPLVFKPNRNALGIGLVFIEKNERSQWVLTMAYNARSESLLTFNETERALQALRSNGVRAIRVDEDASLVQATIDMAPAGAARTLSDALTAIVMTGAEEWSDRRAIVETRMGVFRYQGRAYETRHYFQGNLKTREARIHRHDNPTAGEKGWFARVGSSAFFSNHTGRPGSYKIDSHHLFDPLYESFAIPAFRRPAFEEYVARLVGEAFAHACAQAQREGLDADDDVRGQFDLMWLPPEPGSNGFPRPVLIESWFRHVPAVADTTCATLVAHNGRVTSPLPGLGTFVKP